MAAVPKEVLARLGPAPRDLSRLGYARVLEGNGLVLKAGPADRTAREAFVLSELSGTLPLTVPSVLEAGPSWLLLLDLQGIAGWQESKRMDIIHRRAALAYRVSD